MGSQSDWQTMRKASEILEELLIPHEIRIVSAHRTPKRMAEYADTARARGCLLYTSPSPRDLARSRMPSSA